MSTSLTFASLFTGAGGLDLGFAKAGFTPVFANDIFSHAVATYNNIHTITDPVWERAASRFKNHVAVEGNIIDTFDFSHIKANVVIGGPPCQGFSVAGKMDPEDERSRLVFSFLDAVSTIAPDAFVMENVPALATNKKWSHILESLVHKAGVNYDVELHVLTASDWGVPQARKRMFLIGLPKGSRTCLESAETYPELISRQALLTLPPAGTPENPLDCTAKIVPTKNPELRKSPYAGLLFNGSGHIINLDRPAPTMTASMGGNATHIVDTRALYFNEDPWIVTYHSHLINGGDPYTCVPDYLRRITTREAAALQTFPTDMPWAGAKTAVFKQIGNAVPPMLAYHVARHMKNALT